jgi:hypothetical protein
MARERGVSGSKQGRQNSSQWAYVSSVRRINISWRTPVQIGNYDTGVSEL